MAAIRDRVHGSRGVDLPVNRLANCPRCGQDIILREGVKHGKPAWLEYDADGTRQHKLECPKIHRESKK